MSNKLKLVTLVGTRPEIIKLAATIRACDQFFDHVLVHTGQNWDPKLKQVFFDEFGLREPDHYLDAVGEHLGATIGNIVSTSYELLERVAPDALLILGDTNSALAAISAKRLKIPIFHMEAGNRCFDENLPEEINRRIVDHVSDVNLPYTEHARRNLVAEGLPIERVFVTGSPMPEVISLVRDGIDSSDVLERLDLEADRYFLVSAHREENIDDERNFDSLMAALDEIAEEYQFPIVYSAHPRTRNRMQQRGTQLHPLVRIVEPFGFCDYNRLQLEAFCVLSDSGTLAEESAILGFSGISLRTSTERPEVLDKGTFVVGGITAPEILQSIQLVRTAKAANATGERVIAPDYVDDNVSIKVVKLIQSYTGIVNRTVWRKQ